MSEYSENKFSADDALIGALVGLARAVDAGVDANDGTYELIAESLAMLNEDSAGEARIMAQIEKLHTEKRRLVPDCAVCTSPCGRTADGDISLVWNGEEKIRALKILILYSLRGIAVYVKNAFKQVRANDEVNRFLCEGLFMIGYDCGVDDLLPVAMRAGEMTMKCKADLE